MTYLDFFSMVTWLSTKQAGKLLAPPQTGGFSRLGEVDAWHAKPSGHSGALELENTAPGLEVAEDDVAADLEGQRLLVCLDIFLFNEDG